ncbi:Protein YIPF1 homolog [Linum grandiflorum]
MHTFPPASNVRGGGGGGGGSSSNRGYQTMGDPTEGVEQQTSPNSWKGVFSVSSYTQYFNVDTDIVINRLMSSFYPIGGDFFSKIHANPDLYGLVWISTTLVFLLASLGNCATYLMMKRTDSSASWSFDVGYANTATMLIFGYVIIVPLGFYFLLQYLGSNASLIRFWCMWGYSLFIFVLCSVPLLIPVEFLRWLIILAAGVESACFVTANLKTFVQGADLNIVLVASFLLQLALAIFIKVWFFP